MKNKRHVIFLTMLLCMVTTFIWADESVGLEQKQLDGIGTAVNTIMPNTWYVIFNGTRPNEMGRFVKAGELPGKGGVLYDNGSEKTLKKNIADIVAGFPASQYLQYLVRFIDASGEGEQNVYYVQFANGNYLKTDLYTTDNRYDGGKFNIYPIANNNEGLFGFNEYNMARLVCNNGVNGTLVYWRSGELTSTDYDELKTADTYCSVWSIHPVILSELDMHEVAIAELSSVANEYNGYYNSLTSSMIGTQPGQYSTSSRAAFRSALNAAQNVLDNPSELDELTIDDIYSLIQTIRDTYQALLDSKMPYTLVDGYYRIKSAMSFNTGDKYMYSDLNTTGASAKWGTPENLSVDASALWRITNSCGCFDIVNVGTNTHFNNVARSSAVGMSASSTNLMALDPITRNGITYLNIRVSSQNGEDGLYLHTAGHFSGNGVSGNLVGWYSTMLESGPAGSEWVLVSVDETAANSIIEAYIPIFEQKNRNLTFQSLLAEANTTYESNSSHNAQYPDAATILWNAISTADTIENASQGDVDALATALHNYISTFNSVQLSDSTRTINKGLSHQLTISIGNNNVIWISTDESVATVDTNGLVTALNEGNTLIIAISKYSEVCDTCSIVVTSIPVSYFKLSKSTVTINKGKHHQLSATIYPGNANNKDIMWLSTDESVAAIDTNGMITAINIGNTLIIATTEDGGLSDTCSVMVVTIPISSIQLNKSGVTISKGWSYQLKPIVQPADATNTNVVWSSTDESVVTVDGNGLVTAIKNGTAIILAQAEDGNKTAMCTITVENLVDFADNKVKALCVTNWDSNGDGELSMDEAAAVTDIGTKFKQQTGITSFDELRSFTALNNIPSNAFYGCSNLTSVTLPESVTSIGSSAFYNCVNLKAITIPTSVTSINSSAFYGCTKLANVTLPNSVTSLGSSAFWGCSSLQSVVIGNGVTELPDYVFGTGTNLKSLTIGSKAQTISQYAFRKSSGATAYKPIKTIWMVNTPPTNYSYAGGTVNYVPNSQYSSLSGVSVYSFLSSMFEVDGVKYVPVSPSERTCDAIDCRYDETAASVNIGETVTYRNVALTVKEIKPYTFYRNSFVANVLLNNQGDIGEYAFYGITGAYTANINNIGTIDTYAFSGSTGLDTLEVGSSVTDIREKAFYGCNGLTTAIVQNVGTWGNKIFQNCTALQNVEIGDSVTSIGDYAFDGCGALQAIIIPDSVQTLGAYAFRNCSSLTTAEIGKNVSAINTYAFSGCSQLADVQLGDSIQTIGTYAFNGCSSLPMITIPKMVTAINDYAFSGCTSLSTVIMEDKESELTLGHNGSSPLFASCPLDSVYIGRNITYSTNSSDGYSPFYRNTSLRGVHITNRETEISDYEFYGCSNLKNVRVGDGITSIGKWAFSGCASLEYFAFGRNVQSIGQEAFSDCISVTNIISLASTPPVCGTQALDDINKWSCTLSVPEGTMSAYQVADQWQDFFFMDEISVPLGDFDGDGDITTDDVEILVDIVLGKTVGVYDASSADINNDGKVSVADITALVNMLKSI